jgi:hypothetical protein
MTAGEELREVGSDELASARRRPEDVSAKDAGHQRNGWQMLAQDSGVYKGRAILR